MIIRIGSHSIRSTMEPKTICNKRKGRPGTTVTIREGWQTPFRSTYAQGTECSHSTHYTWVTLREDAFLGQLLLSQDVLIFLQALAQPQELQNHHPTSGLASLGYPHLGRLVNPLPDISTSSPRGWAHTLRRRNTSSGPPSLGPGTRWYPWPCWSGILPKITYHHILWYVPVRTNPSP